MAEKKIATGYIGNALRSSAADHTTTFTDEVFDTERQKYQSEVNTDIEGKIEAEAEARIQNDQLLSQAIAVEQERAEAAEQANAQGIIYDVSAHNDGAVFESLSALLSDTNLNTLIPTSVRHGGMSIRFIQGSEQSSDNKYIQARCMAQNFTTDVTQWQGVDDEPISGSDNFVKSNGIKNQNILIIQELYGFKSNIVEFWINSQNAINLDGNGIAIAVKEGDTLSVKAGNTSAYYCEVGKLSGMSSVLNGSRVPIEANQTRTITIAQGTHYVWISNRLYDGQNFYPVEVILNDDNITKSIKDIIDDIVTNVDNEAESRKTADNALTAAVNLETEERIRGDESIETQLSNEIERAKTAEQKINTELNDKYIPIPTTAINGSLKVDGTIVTDYGICHAMLDVRLFRGAHITITSTYPGFQYAFIKSYTPTSVVFCSGEGRVDSLPKDSLIPDDANYMYILCGSYSDPTFPSTITTDEDSIGIKTKVENLEGEIVRKLKKLKICLRKDNSNMYFYDIYIPTYDNENYIRIPFKHIVDASKNADSWRVRCAYLSDGVSDIKSLVTNGEWEMAVQLVGRPDFIGGELHGDEVVQSITSFIDGVYKPFPLSPEGTFYEADEISFIEITNMYDPSNTETQVATHRKFYVFTRDGLRLRQRIEWLGSYSLTYSYLAMFPVERKWHGLQITDQYHDNKNYVCYDVSEQGFGGYPTVFKSGVTSQFLNGSDSGVSASIEILKFTPDIASRISFLADTQYYNKMYFDFCGESYSVNNGDVWETDVQYRLNKK